MEQQTDRLAALRQRLDEWSKSTEYARTTTRPMDAGEQMAQRDAHALLTDFDAEVQSLRAERDRR